MDIIKFNPSTPGLMDNPELINDIKSVLWVERYTNAGEFKIVANVDSGLKDKLPLGSFITHKDSLDLMIVENHDIGSDRDKTEVITITGRSFETILEGRVVGGNQNYTSSSTIPEDYMTSFNLFYWGQIGDMIKEHIGNTTGGQGVLANTYDWLPNVDVYWESFQSRIPSYQDFNGPKKVLRGDLYSRVLEMLPVLDLGIKNIRPGLWSPMGWANDDVRISIHYGQDRRSTVSFSYDTGEVLRADYFWSQKNFKNVCVVVGKWTGMRAITPGTSLSSYFGRKTMYVDGSDIDSQYTVRPTGTVLTDVRNLMLERGRGLLSSQQNIVLLNPEIAKEGIRNRYRFDYGVGDIVTINADYNESVIMRVIEYVESEDENGYVGYPTLSLFEEIVAP